MPQRQVGLSSRVSLSMGRTRAQKALLAQAVSEYRTAWGRLGGQTSPGHRSATLFMVQSIAHCTVLS